jgi:photosystem II stability/assembly factor-like uncharacterized protein
MNDRIFIATTGHGLARAECRASGEWTVTRLLEKLKVNCLAADPLNPDVVYAGTSGGGVLRSDDRGQHWYSAGLDGKTVKSLAASPIQASVLYAGTKPPMIFVSRDGGVTWTELDAFRPMRRWYWFTPAEPGAPYVQAIALSPTDPDVIVAGIEFGAVLRSADGGRTWQGHLKGAIRDCHSLAFHARSGDWVYQAGGSGGGAAVSRDAGVTWTQPKVGLDRHYGWTCAADPARPEVWYVSVAPTFVFPHFTKFPIAHFDGYAHAHIFRTTGGAGWQKLDGGLPQPLDYMPYALLTDPAEPGHVYAGLSSGDVWFSADHGDVWQQLPFNLGGIYHAMIML